MATLNGPVRLAQTNAQIRLTQRSPAYWRVTIDNQPINVMSPKMVKQFQEAINALEADEQVRVVVFDSAESTPLRSRVAMGVSSAWRHRKAGGFISVGVRSVGTSVAATVLRASMRPSIRRQQDIRSLPASRRVRSGSTITRSGE